MSDSPAATSLPRDSTFLDIYSNQLRISANISDIMIVFGTNEDIGTNQLVIKDKAAIRLAMPTAKSLVIHLQAAIAAYEASVSAIQLPYGAEENADNMREAIQAALQGSIRQPTGTN